MSKDFDYKNGKKLVDQPVSTSFNFCTLNGLTFHISRHPGCLRMVSTAYLGLHWKPCKESANICL